METIIYIIKNILSPLFYKIATISIHATIVGIILLIITKIFKRKISCKINPIVWIIFLISLLISPKIENKFSIYNFINLDKIEELSININFNSLDTYDNLDIKENYEFKDFKIKVKSQIDKLETKEIIALIYFGAIFLKIIKTIFITTIYCKTDKQRLDKNSKEYILIEKIKNKLNIKKDINLIKTNYVSSPMIGGLFVPKIFISNSQINEIDFECMLTHEISHYKRKDYILNIFINLFRTIYFFNPIIIICLNRIEKDIELATDELTLKVLDENKKNRYCNLIVLMSRNANKDKTKLGFSKNKSFVEERINTIISKRVFLPKKKYIIILIIISSLIIFFCFTKEKIYIDDNELKYLTINIANIDYVVENWQSCNEYKIIKCNKSDEIILGGNENLYSLSLNTIDLKTNIENNSTFFFYNNDIKIHIGKENGKFLYELKIKYKTNKEVKYCFIIEVE